MQACCGVAIVVQLLSLAKKTLERKLYGELDKNKSIRSTFLYNLHSEATQISKVRPKAHLICIPQKQELHNIKVHGLKISSLNKFTNLHKGVVNKAGSFIFHCLLALCRDFKPRTVLYCKRNSSSKTIKIERKLFKWHMFLLRNNGVRQPS